jgi:hypothetical protein
MVGRLFPLTKEEASRLIKGKKKLRRGGGGIEEEEKKFSFF